MINIKYHFTVNGLQQKTFPASKKLLNVMFKSFGGTHIHAHVHHTKKEKNMGQEIFFLLEP